MDIRVLVVEDEWSVAEMIKEALAESGCLVDIALTGMAAKTAIDTNKPYTFIITDVMLPDMDGYAVAETLLGKSPQTFVVFYTGRSGAEVRRDIQHLLERMEQKQLPRLRACVYLKPDTSFLNDLLGLVNFLKKIQDVF